MDGPFFRHTRRHYTRDDRRLLWSAALVLLVWTLVALVLV